MSVSAEGHRLRMRQRLQQMEVDEIRSQDLMEYLLYYALPRRDTKQQAYDLLEHFGSVEAVLNADEKALTAVKGIGVRTAVWLRSVGRMLATYEDLEPDDKPYLGNLASAAAYLERFFAQSSGKQMWQFCLNAGGRLIGCMKLADYACWRAPEYVRMAMEQALRIRAGSVLLCYFTDEKLQRIEEDELESVRNYGYALSVTGMSLLDHIVLSREGLSSMVREKLIIRAEGGSIDEVTEMMCENARLTGYLEGERDPEYDCED